MYEESSNKKSFDYASASVEQIREAVKAVEDRVAKKHAEQADPAGKEGERDKAARFLQDRYRSGRPLNLTSSERWTEGIRARKLSGAGKEQDQGVNDASSRWKRSQVFAAKLSEGQHAKKDGEPEMTEEEEMKKFGRNKKERKRIKEEREISQNMQAKYWLEMVDAKHRYGTNLKWYHQAWNESDSPMNFFKWLDEGPGKDLDLEQCPRAKLEKERITYLTAETRKNYLVKVTNDGKLVWAKNDEPVDTTKYHKDAGPETGIVKISKEELEQNEKQDKEKRQKIRDNGGKEVTSSSSSSSSSDDAEEVVEGTEPHGDKGGTAGSGKGLKQSKAQVSYYTVTVPDKPETETFSRISKHFSHLGSSRWLYVTDLKGNLYVSLKVKGRLQHSSILYGARVMSAGLIKVDNGTLTSLSPLSGHYRAGTMHFRAFVRSLEERHVDMSSVSIAKSVVTIRAMEKRGKFSKKKSALKDRIKAGLGLGKSEEEMKKEEKERDESLVKNKEQQHQDDDSSSSSSPSEVEDIDDENEDGGMKKKWGQKLNSMKELPGQGKNIDDMTVDERTERGVALIQRAFERGMKLQEDTIKEKAHEKQVKHDEANAKKEHEQNGGGGEE